MGGRGSGGSKNGGGGAANKSTKNIGEGITDKNELINLYNSISGSSSYTVEQRVEAMKSIKERIDKLDAKKAEDLKQKRLDALAKARAKRKENLKNGVKTEKKSKAKTSVDSTAYDLKHALIRGVETDGTIRTSDFRSNTNSDGSIDLDIRYLGKWKNPSHARNEEDYDWQELSSKSSKQINKVIKTVQKQSGRKITCDGSEKNWLSFHID